MIGSRHRSACKRLIESDQPKIIFGSIRQVFGIVIFAFHANVNGYDDCITALNECISYDTAHVFIKIEPGHA